MEQPPESKLKAQEAEVVQAVPQADEPAGAGVDLVDQVGDEPDIQEADLARALANALAEITRLREIIRVQAAYIKDQDDLLDYYDRQL